MISTIIYLFYLLIIFFLTTTCLFIAYHFKKYSINASLNNIILPFFVIGSIILIVCNIIVFSSIDWSKYNTPLNLNINNNERF